MGSDPISIYTRTYLYEGEEVQTDRQPARQKHISDPISIYTSTYLTPYLMQGEPRQMKCLYEECQVSLAKEPHKNGDLLRKTPDNCGAFFGCFFVGLFCKRHIKIEVWY